MKISNCQAREGEADSSGRQTWEVPAAFALATAPATAAHVEGAILPYPIFRKKMERKKTMKTHSCDHSRDCLLTAFSNLGAHRYLFFVFTTYLVISAQSLLYLQNSKFDFQKVSHTGKGSQKLADHNKSSRCLSGTLPV
jgi:hypothetical protein